MKVDLHVHTNNSDGDLSIEEVLKLAKKNDLKEISIADHDTIIKLENFTELEQKYNLLIIPGIEIPTNIRGMHILGYCISNFNMIEQKLINLKNPVDSYNNKLIALVDKFEKYDGLVFECEKKLDDCIIATEEDFETLMKYRNNNLVEQKKENIFVRLFKKLFASKRKFKKEVIEKMNSEIDDIQNSNIKLLDIIENQTINLVAKIEELRYDINYEYSIATE